jgi:hypothetical protein
MPIFLLFAMFSNHFLECQTTQKCSQREKFGGNWLRPNPSNPFFSSIDAFLSLKVLGIKVLHRQHWRRRCYARCTGFISAVQGGHLRQQWCLPFYIRCCRRQHWHQCWCRKLALQTALAPSLQYYIGIKSSRPCWFAR